MRTRVWVGAAVVVAVAAGIWWVAAAGGDAEAEDEGTAPRSTATVERRDLVDRETVDGTLGYSDAATLTSGATGTLTDIAAEGTTVGRGEPLYAIDDVGIPLLFGDVPAWRTLALGIDDGVDVLQLERNLEALGYGDDLEVDREFDGDTADAIEEIQADLGLDETGVMAFGSYVFAPGERRVGSHAAEVGQGLAPGTAIMETTSTSLVVTVDLAATRRDLAVRGDDVTVTMPDDREVTGTIRSVGSVASTPVDDPTADATVEVVVAIRATDAEGGLDGAPVDVGFASDVQEGATAVPVTALLALAEGGYALEVVGDGGATSLVAIDVGLYADGWVEVDGEGIEPGVEVVTAA
jgi:hypothetical protein